VYKPQPSKRRAALAIARLRAIIITPGDTDALVGALRRLSQEPETVAEMGLRARKMLDAHFSRQQGLARWRELLERLE
jgi:glycosyltransferase involved in cell wall biosynthesis